MNFNYSASKFEHISCNLCGKNNFSVLAERSANGLEARTCMCRNCGLIFINPRMTKASYDDYYKYFYREDRSAAISRHDSVEDLERNFKGVRKFGRQMAVQFGKFIGEGKVIDVGSSTGGILYGIKEIIPNIVPLGIEPSLEESAYAVKKGIETHVGLFEDLGKAGEDRFRDADSIICVRSLNHLLDPKSFFLWAYKNLRARGHLILSVKDFREQARRAGRLEAGIQIDHPYMFTAEVLRKFVESAGFYVVRVGVDWQKKHHIIMVAEKRGIPNNPIGFSTIQYIKYAIPFWKPFLRAKYLARYSHRLSFFRRKILRKLAL